MIGKLINTAGKNMVGNIYHQAILSLRKPTIIMLGQVVQTPSLDTLLNDPNAGTVLHYIGNNTTAVMEIEKKFHYRTCPSVVMRLCKTNDSPSNVYKHEESVKCLSHLQSAYLPRNVKQIQNARAQDRQKFCLSHDTLYNLLMTLLTLFTKLKHITTYLAGYPNTFVV